MKKHFLLLMLMALLPFAGFAQIDISSDYNVQIDGTGAYIYKGANHDLDLVVKYKDAVKALTQGIDFTVEIYADANLSEKAEFKDAGDYYVTAKGTGDYTGETTPLKVTITKKALNVTMSVSKGTLSKTYDGTTELIAGIEWSASGTGYATGDNDASILNPIMPNLTWSYSNPNVAGGHPITFGGLSSRNYDIACTTSETLTITAKPLTEGMVTAATISKMYKGKVYTPATDLSVTVKDGSTPLTVSTDYVIKTYQEEGLSTEVAAPQNVAKYYIAVEGGSTNYSGKIAAGTFEITQANLTVKANDQTKVYDGDDVSTSIETSNQYTLIGLVGDDNDSKITGAKTVKVSVADGAKTGVGSYTINPTSGAFTNENYKIFYQPGTYTITQASLTIAATDETIVVGGTPVLAFTIDGAKKSEADDMKDAEKGNVKVSIKEGTSDAVGTYKDVLEVSYNAEADVFKNYAVSTTKGTLTINGGTIVVTVNPQSIVYGEVEPTWPTPEKGKDYFVNGVSGDVELNVVLTRENAENKGYGTYAVTANVAELPVGYTDINYVNSTFTIKKRPISVNALAQTLAVGRTAENLDLSKIEITEGEEIGLAPDEKAEEVLKLVFATSVKNNVAGSYSKGIEVALTDDASANYDLTQTPADLTIVDAIVLNRPAKDSYKDSNLNDAAEVIAAADGQKKSVTFGDYTLLAEKWYPIVLPFETNVADVSKAFGYAIVNILNPVQNDAETISFKLHMQTIPANTPFVVKVYKEINMNTVTFDAVTIKDSKDPSTKAGDVKFIGTYEGKIGFAANEYFFSAAAGNNDYYNGSSTNSTYLRPLGAYLQLAEGSAARVISFEEADGGTTAISIVKSDNSAVSAEGWYNLNGVRIEEPTQKGIYIHNGKKVVIK